MRKHLRIFEKGENIELLLNVKNEKTSSHVRKGRKYRTSANQSDVGINQRATISKLQEREEKFDGNKDAGEHRNIQCLSVSSSPSVLVIKNLLFFQ